jgi:hypothetical protein
LCNPGEFNWQFRGIIPPREGKEYRQHPIGSQILNFVRDATPDVLTFWGVGFTYSDMDLVAVYKKWARFASTIEMIHPEKAPPALSNAENLLSTKIMHYLTPEDWQRAAP